MVIHEGMKIPADGRILKSSDFRVDESSLTGEAEAVWKDFLAEDTEDYWKKNFCYAGTLAVLGTAFVLVEKTGITTEYGKIGVSISKAPSLTSPLKKQTDTLVKVCVLIAGVLFALVSLATWVNTAYLPFKGRLIGGVLSGITLAMAMIPEEFPVVLTVFLSMGAWRLAKKNSLVRSLSSVETLGAVSVLCVDKTGTLTMNKMSVYDIWAFENDEERLCNILRLACETEAYDPMEKAVLEYCPDTGFASGMQLVKEYPFTNELKMMGHVLKRGDEILIAAKGSPESILSICGISSDERRIAEQAAKKMSAEGLRVIAAGSMDIKNGEDMPGEIESCRLKLAGLIGLMDPVREGIKEDIAACLKAGIKVIMITGDNGETAAAAAKKAGMENVGEIITGAMLEAMTDEELKEKINTAGIFSRVIPEHKMRIVKALRENGEVVAMTGDGVNDAPALKYADIGIAMGKRGSEVSREAADLILLDDNFSTIVDSIKDGRRIYDNIKKAVGYIFSIHIPIALASLIAPVLGIPSAELFLLPIHVVLLELVIDPTCSVVLERRPPESDIMERPPRARDEKIADKKLLVKSAFQGLAVFAASFGAYYSALLSGEGAPGARSAGIAVLIVANVFIVQVNMSENDFVFTSAKKLIKDKVISVSVILTVLMLVLILYTPVSGFLKLTPLSFKGLVSAVFLAAVSVFWIEALKLFRKKKRAG